MAGHIKQIRSSRIASIASWRSSHERKRTIREPSSRLIVRNDEVNMSLLFYRLPLHGHVFISLECWRLRRESAVHVFETRWNSRSQIPSGQNHKRSGNKVNVNDCYLWEDSHAYLLHAYLFFFTFLFQNFLQVLLESLNLTFIFLNHLWGEKIKHFKIRSKNDLNSKIKQAKTVKYFRDSIMSI